MIECKVATLSTFLGPVTVMETARGVRHVDLLDDGARQFAREAAGRFLRLPGEPECAQEFRDYFAGRLRAFTCPMDLVGTDFQRRCWLAVERSVPFGETITYAQEARLAGTTGYQAVGQANRRNPLAIRQTGSRGLNLSTAGSINNGSSLASMRVVLEAVAAYGQY